MTSMKDEWDDKAINSDPNKRAVYGVVKVGCDIQNHGHCPHKTHLFIRKLDTRSEIPGSEDQWVNLGTQKWDFKAGDWTTDNNLANSLDSVSFDFIIYDGSDSEKTKQSFLEKLDIAKASYIEEMNPDSKLECE